MSNLNDATTQSCLCPKCGNIALNAYISYMRDNLGKIVDCPWCHAINQINYMTELGFVLEEAGPFSATYGSMAENQDTLAQLHSQFQRADSYMYQEVKNFYDTMGFVRPAKPSRIPAARRNELMAYILSESLEFGAARDLKDQADAAVDLLYFVMDVFVELGIDPQIPFEIVHEANMAKVWPDGTAHFDHSVVPPRMLKPDGWQAPEPALHDYIEELLNNDGTSKGQ